MSKFHFKTLHRQRLADTLTPVAAYLKLRDRFPGSLLLESSDYHSREDSFSYIALQPIASFKVHQNLLDRKFPNGEQEQRPLTENDDLPSLLQSFAGSFRAEPLECPFQTAGLFGHMSYDAVRYFEDIEIKAPRKPQKDIPEVYYQLFQLLVVFDHFRNELHLIEQLSEDHSKSRLQELDEILNSRGPGEFPFALEGEESSNISDEEYRGLVESGKEHCQRGDVFQIVLSREFRQSYTGDEFNVYRSLRAINPSPYLFYFDYGSFRIFGSSPEAQLKIHQGRATINPIAGTYRRSGNDEEDASLARQLQGDPKENSEHVMLVDLARNDLSRHCEKVEVETYAQIQFFSHVIHMVSEVQGELSSRSRSMQVVADTFPAGTLSGAPKYRAMQLIDQYENSQRSFYGGAIGMIDFEGSFNHAIMIRSMLSKNNQLIYQAGAGIVADSSPENELQEVNNKVAALRKALSRTLKEQV